MQHRPIRLIFALFIILLVGAPILHAQGGVTVVANATDFLTETSH